MPESFGNVLCIRADNMGDVIMSSPALYALKQSFGSKITLMTSRAGALIAPHLDCVDELLVVDLPWVKSLHETPVDLQRLIGEIAQHEFDAAIIFTVYSQSSLPAAMLAYMAGIPVRVAYARENPYDLLSTWLPDHEPYGQILHQVERDLNLVKALGANGDNSRLRLSRAVANVVSVQEKLSSLNLSLDRPFLVLHPGVSEDKRKYPAALWIEVGKLLIQKIDLPVLVSGAVAEKELAEAIARGIGTRAHAVAGALSLGEFIELIGHATCVVSVNTSTIHVAAATQTPVVVLYAQTNPQHTPWRVPHSVLPFSVPVALRSRNPIIRHVAERLYFEDIPYPAPEAVTDAVERLIRDADRAPATTRN